MAQMLRILVIDDDPIQRAIVHELVSGMGHACAEAADGEAGLACVKAAPVDLVVCDMLMPEKDGVETILEIRRTRPALPVIAMSSGGKGLSPDYLLQLARGVGADAVMEKPLRAEAFCALVSRLGAGRPVLAEEA